MKHWEGKFQHGLCIWEDGMRKGGANPLTPVICFTATFERCKTLGFSLMCFVSRTANNRQNLKQVTLTATVMPWWLQVIIGKIALRSSLIISWAGVENFPLIDIIALPATLRPQVSEPSIAIHFHLFYLPLLISLVHNSPSGSKEDFFFFTFCFVLLKWQNPDNEDNGNFAGILFKLTVSSSGLREINDFFLYVPLTYKVTFVSKCL